MAASKVKRFYPQSKRLSHSFVNCDTPVRPKVTEGSHIDIYSPGMGLQGVTVTPSRHTSSDQDFEDFNFNSDDSENGLYGDTPTNNVLPIPPQITIQNSLISPEIDVITMLQQQQAVLQEVLDGQKELQQRQNQMEEKLICLQSKVDNPPNIDAQSSSSDGKRKRVVTRTLSVSETICKYACMAV